MKKDFKLLFALYFIVSCFITALMFIITSAVFTDYRKDYFIISIFFIIEYFIIFLNCSLAKVLNDMTDEN